MAKSPYSLLYHYLTNRRSLQHQSFKTTLIKCESDRVKWLYWIGLFEILILNIAIFYILFSGTSVKDSYLIIAILAQFCICISAIFKTMYTEHCKNLRHLINPNNKE